MGRAAYPTGATDRGSAMNRVRSLIAGAPAFAIVLSIGANAAAAGLSSANVTEAVVWNGVTLTQGTMRFAAALPPSAMLFGGALAAGLLLRRRVAGRSGMSVTALALMLFAGVVTAAPLGTWSGPSDRACLGRCAAELAAAALPETRLAQLRKAMEREARPLWVRDGDVLTLMTYYDDGQVNDTRGCVATLDHPEIGSGWRLPDGALFMQIAACGNWALIDSRSIGSTVTPARPKPAVPLPASLLLLLSALAGIFSVTRNRRA